LNRFERILGAPKNTKVVKNRKVRIDKPVPVEPKKPFEDKLRDNDYDSKLPWPEAKDPDRQAKREAYNADEARLLREFKADMFEDCGVTGHPKADKAFDIAWSHGHASGLYDVYCYFSELAELLRP